MNGADGARGGARRGRSPARALRRWLVAALVLFAVVVAGRWAWQQPAMQRWRMAARLARMPPPAALPVPVQGVRPARIADTFGAPRGRTRRHEGVDIFARRGTPVRSATVGIVAAVREGGLGGRQVWVLGPGLERHYYAHLDDWAAGLQAGDLVVPGAPLGIVGDTGNARGTPLHLHYGIYTARGAVDPLPRLTACARVPDNHENADWSCHAGPPATSGAPLRSRPDTPG